MGGIVKNQQGLRGANRLLAWQLAITLLVAVIVAVISGGKSALSAMLGGLVSALPSAYFARKLFQYQGAQAAKQIVNSFYKGEAMKIILSILLFALVFIFSNVNPVVFFITYIVVQMVYWFAPLLFANKQNRPERD